MLQFAHEGEQAAGPAVNCVVRARDELQGHPVSVGMPGWKGLKTSLFGCALLWPKIKLELSKL
jgi:hypothetical protein